MSYMCQTKSYQFLDKIEQQLVQISTHYRVIYYLRKLVHYVIHAITVV